MGWFLNWRICYETVDGFFYGCYYRMFLNVHHKFITEDEMETDYSKPVCAHCNSNDYNFKDFVVNGKFVNILYTCNECNKDFQVVFKYVYSERI